MKSPQLLPCAGHCSKPFPCLSSLSGIQPCEVGSVVTIIQMKPLKHREVKEPRSNRNTMKLDSNPSDLNPALLNSEKLRDKEKIAQDHL